LDLQIATFDTQKKSGLKLVNEFDEIKYRVVSAPWKSKHLAAMNDIVRDKQWYGSIDANMSKWD
jgi:hypothetical protein